MTYTDNDIATVRGANDIVDVVSEVVSLRRQGRLAWALCPFHKEKTPSFKVDSATGLYYCFGCREGGDVIRFVEKTRGLSFVEAVEYLAARAGIMLVGSGSTRRDKAGRRQLHDAVSEAANFYHRHLLTSPKAAKARSYLEERGIGSDSIARFRLGYSPESYDSLTRYLREKGFTEQTMVDAGLAVRKESGRLIDFFRGRVMFPICDAAGRPIAFGGRILPDAPPEAGPKYRNSSTTRLYEKSHALYGFHLARKHISEKGCVVVVEGYTDVIALHKIGVTNAVATCGTAFGSEHVEILRRHGLTVLSEAGSPPSPASSLLVILAFDADTAGELAGGRAVDQVLTSGAAQFLEVRIAILPEGKDPADLAAESEEELRALLDQATPALEFLIEKALEQTRLDSVESRVSAARIAVKQVLRHPDPIVQQQYLQRIAEMCRLDPKDVRQIWSETRSWAKGASTAASSAKTAKQLGGSPLPGRRVHSLGKSNYQTNSSPSSFVASPKNLAGGSTRAGSATPSSAGSFRNFAPRAFGGSNQNKSSVSESEQAISESGYSFHNLAKSPKDVGSAPASGAYSPTDSTPDSKSHASFKSARGVVPAIDIDKIRLHIYGSAEAVSAMQEYELSDVIKSEAARRAIEALIEARGDVAEALRCLDASSDARDALMLAASGSFDLSEEDVTRWEASVLDDARKRALEKQATRAKAAGDFEAYNRIWKELKGVSSAKLELRAETGACD